MSKFEYRCWKRLKIASGSAVALAALLVWPSYAVMDEPEPVLRIEEDWELVLNQPNDLSVSPQFATVMSPFPHMNSYYAQTLWNYRETPDFVPGGVQLHSYNGEHLLRMRSVESKVLSTTAETITWSQSLETDGSLLTFAIFDGQSATWGSFGRDMNISSSSALSNLNQYDPELSAANACVTYGSNRVESLTLKQVRYYGSDGLLAVDDTPRKACQ